MNLILDNLSNFDFCSNNDILKIISLLGNLLRIFKLVIPIVIIIYGIFDLYKGIMNPDNIKSSSKVFLKRIISGLLIFLLPEIVIVAFNFIKTDINLNSTCLNVFLNPKEYNSSNSNKNSSVSNYSNINTDEKCNNLGKPYIWKNGQCIIDMSNELID